MWFGCITFAQILVLIRFRDSHESLALYFVCGVNLDTKFDHSQDINTTVMSQTTAYLRKLTVMVWVLIGQYVVEESLDVRLDFLTVFTNVLVILNMVSLG